MVRDFTRYQHEPSAVNEKKLYEYQPTGKKGATESEVVVALDFGEIVTLEVSKKQKPEKQRALSRAVA